MIRQICKLTKLQLMNIYGINVFRHTKDKTQKRKKIGMCISYIAIAIIAAIYIGAMAYGYIYMGLSSMLPAYIIMLSSFIILFFSIFKAGSVIFSKDSYDILASLPVHQSAIVISRFLRMYVENLILTLVVMIPSMTVYGIMIGPKVSFYVLGLIVALFIPFIPITISTFIGAVITAISSRMKHKSLVNVFLSLALIVGIMVGTSGLSAMEDEFSMEMLENMLDTILSVIESIYPPAIWLGDAMLTGDYISCLICVIVGLLIFVAVMAIVSAGFHWICRGLYASIAKHNYRMESLKKSSVLGTLYKRELKRYFSSSIYVVNTIIGPIMAVCFSVTVLVVGVEQIGSAINNMVDVKGAVPLLLAGILCIMSTTCTSVSMEGKEWWIVKSLPIKTKELLDSKLLLGISIVFPFFVISEIILIIALGPNIMELIWMVILPAVLILLVLVFGITINLKMPVFNWENEVSVVKQSASAFIGGLGGFVIVLLFGVPTLLVPGEYGNLTKTVVCIVVTLLTLILYRKNNKTELKEL